MGLRNLRAICPNCGGKIHTQPKGAGHLTWANTWMTVQTGDECQHCGVELSGKVGPDNKAIATDDPAHLAQEAKREAKAAKREAQFDRAKADNEELRELSRKLKAEGIGWWRRQWSRSELAKEQSRRRKAAR